ncbi:hypothetical protein [Clostridium sporogenes]|uniref:hypothetical protein n=1 Tax=Clostridium sporogenes TaxID=1509 RepID=UPI0013D6A579|nr:hypothetical protein [Clostridium sporogenes]MDU1348308.1 hypothetical protein [Clostridium argentinense]NFG01737.1 hypothetical protein [Clostridium sporogenes]
MKEYIVLMPTNENRIALVESKNGKPTLLIEYINNEFHIFYKATLTNGFNLYKANKLLHSLNTGIDIKFENFSQYNELLKSIADKLNIPYVGV